MFIAYALENKSSSNSRYFNDLLLPSDGMCLKSLLMILLMESPLILTIFKPFVLFFLSYKN